MPDVLRVFADGERGKEMMEIYGDVFGHAVDAVAIQGSCGDLAYRHALSLVTRAKRDELAGPNPTPLELVLCERVAACWLDVNIVERMFSKVHDGESVAVATFRDKRRDRANRRFLAACRSLAVVRKLLKPMVTNYGPANISVSAEQAVVAVHPGAAEPRDVTPEPGE
jgi:hypothetical protein